MLFDPAALGRFDRSSVQLEFSGIATSLRLRNAEATTGPGTPVGGVARKGDVADDAELSSFYAVVVPHDDVRPGLGINVPLGLGTDYPGGCVGRCHTLESSFASINVNAVIAYEAADWLTVASGLQVQWSEAELINAVDFGTIGSLAGVAGAAPTEQHGRATVKGDGWGFGYNLGVLAEPRRGTRRGTRFGLAYRSAIDTTLEGDARFRLDASAPGNALRGDLRADYQNEIHIVGVAVNWRFCRAARDVGGQTPLHKSYRSRTWYRIRRAVQHRAPPRSRDKTGRPRGARVGDGPLAKPRPGPLRATASRPGGRPMHLLSPACAVAAVPALVVGTENREKQNRESRRWLARCCSWHWVLRF